MCEQVQANKEEKEGGKIQEGRWDLLRGVTDSKHHFLALFPLPAQVRQDIGGRGVAGCSLPAANKQQSVRWLSSSHNTRSKVRI